MCKVNNNSSAKEREREWGQFMQKILICVRLFARLKYDFRILSVERYRVSLLSPVSALSGYGPKPPISSQNSFDHFFSFPAAFSGSAFLSSPCSTSPPPPPLPILLLLQTATGYETRNRSGKVEFLLVKKNYRYVIKSTTF